MKGVLNILALFGATGLVLCISAPSRAIGAEQTETDEPRSKSQMTSDRGEIQRNFYEVLEDVLGDFEFDLKNGNVSGLKDLSVRNIATSENIPASFKNHLELAITERILKTTKTRVIQCLACRAKRTTLNGEQVIITSPETNPQELSRIAKISNIAHFMDVAFAYHPTGLILSMHITDPDTGGIIWSRSYNSETSKASAFRRGVDHSQMDEARKMTEYQPTIQHRATVYYFFEKDVSAYVGVLGLGFRMVERYDNRHKEVGFEANYMRTVSSIIGSSSSSSSSLYGGLNLTLLFVHAWNLIPGEENFNNVRGTVFGAIGGTYASGFLGGLIRAGYEWRLAKHWAVSMTFGYRPPSTKFLSGIEVGSVTGLEVGLGINGLF